LNKTRWFFLALFVLLLVARLCHSHVLWAEETLPLAAAQQMRAGHVLYRDIWFDKPPFAPIVYTLIGGEAGWLLRTLGAFYAWLCCLLTYGFARDLWGRREGLWAAGLMGFFLTFDFASSVIPLAADLLMVAPHLAAVWLAWRGRALWAGALAGVAFAISPKGLLVLAVCLFWSPTWMVPAGFFLVTAIVSAGLWTVGALLAYWDEVWRWGRLYAGSTFVEAPLRNAVVRTLNWSGFHAAMVCAAPGGLSEVPTASARRLNPWLAWLAISLVGVAAGMRFFPRYYFQLLPLLVLLAARGMAEARSARRLLPLLLLIPLIRFAPSYLQALRDTEWRDSAIAARQPSY